VANKVKVINSALNQNLNGTTFNNVPSQTIFSFDDFYVTTNISDRNFIDYSNTLTSFAVPISLESLNLNRLESELLYVNNNSVLLNLDNSDLNVMTRFGSTYEFFRVSIENILIKYPGSLYISGSNSTSNNVTYFDYSYNSVENTSTFKIPVSTVNNPFELIFKFGDYSILNDNELKNLNISYENYIIWSSVNSSGNTFNVLGYTGNTSGRNYLIVKASGNPFSVTTRSIGYNSFHIKPNNVIFEKYRLELNPYERYILSNRDNINGFRFKIKEPSLDDDGNVIYVDVELLWNTIDGYNINYDGLSYNDFFNRLLNIGLKYDSIKTDLISRFLTPSSLKTYDTTENGKIEKLLRVYGYEFDKIRQFIDSIAYINYLSYDKINNAPDILIKNIANTFGWKYFSLLDDNELVDSFFTIDENERNLNVDLLPSEINIELWRRILINTNYYWKTKGTRESIKSLFMLIGIPEPFINISEYIYTVDGVINPNTITLTENDFPSKSLPYDEMGYPKAPAENSSFYFQISGNKDSGQEYMNVFRKAGFNLNRVIDNKKSWTQSGSTYRYDDLNPEYYQADSKLVLNTKEVDICLDAARGIEYDVFEYLKKDYIINSSGYTLPYSYVNISLGYNGSENTFPLPSDYDADNVLGHLEVRFNGILLNEPYSSSVNADYSVDENTKTFTILNNVYAKSNSNNRDVVQATFVYSGNSTGISGITVQYIVTRVNASLSGTIIPVPSKPNGDLQLTVNGVALTKGTPQFNADYIFDEDNQQIVIQNSDLITFLSENPEVQIAYINVDGSDDIYARNEIYRIDSLNNTRLRYDNNAGKYVYKLNYKVNKASDVKFLIDGIALEPNTDYTVNQQNQYELFVSANLRYGMIISVYYLVGGESIFHPIVLNDYGIGDITNMSFLRFIELISKKMIKVPNRKTISDFKGGWYPLLLKLYNEYIKRSTLDDNNPLKSNGYTFNNLYSFLSKYNSFFHRFVEQVISPTIILRKQGLLVRNTVFTPQKFTYKRGVNLIGNTLNMDARGHYLYEYLGDNGSVFKIIQRRMYVETVEGLVNHKTITTGGFNIIGNSEIIGYGIEYRKRSTELSLGDSWSEWMSIMYDDILTDSEYSVDIECEYNEWYEYRAVVKSDNYGYTGQTYSVLIDESFNIPAIKTCYGETTMNSIITGGYDFINNNDTAFYGMQYRCIDSINNSIFNLNQNELTFDYNSNSNTILVCGNTWNKFDIYKSSDLTWVSTTPSSELSLNGVNSVISVTKNIGNYREGVICYVPQYGDTKYLTIKQNPKNLNYNLVYFNSDESINEPLYRSCTSSLNTSTMGVNDCYLLSLGWYGSSPKSSIDICNSINVVCNNTLIYNQNIVNKNLKQISCAIPKINVKYGDDVKVTVSSTSESIDSTPSVTGVYISKIDEIVGNYTIGNGSENIIGFKAETNII